MGVLFIIMIHFLCAGLIWYGVCAELSYHEREKLREWVFDRGYSDWLTTWQDRAKMLDKVKYDDHFRHRFFLGDPWSIYDDEIQEAMREQS